MAIQDAIGVHDRVHLTDFRVTTGEFVPLDRLAGADVAGNRDALRESGMTGAAVAGERTVELAARVLLDRQLPADLDCVVYTTDDFGDTWPPEVLADLMVSVGRPAVPALIVSGNGCANMGIAVRTAAGLCRKAASVVVVAAGRARPGHRVLTDSMSLLGDGAAACTVTTELTGPGFELVAARSALRAGPAGQGKGVSALRPTLDGVREATKATLAAAGWDTGDLAGMLVGEYSPTACRLLAVASGVKAQFDWVRERAGHCDSADLVRGLDSLLRADRLADGDRLLALSSGNNAWSMLALRYTAGPRS